MLEQAGHQDVMRHSLADTLAARLAGIGRHQVEGFHLVGPFVVVVAATARLAEMGLPVVDHLMHQSRKNFRILAAGEAAWVQGDFVGFRP